MDDRFDLGGRVAVITGGGTGIGAGSARLLGDRGADASSLSGETISVNGGSSVPTEVAEQAP